MKKLLLGLLISAAGSFGANAQIFWKISNPDSKTESYLLGTHHLAPLSMLDSISGFADAMAKVEAVAGEIDMADMLRQAPTLAGHMLAPADSALTCVLSAAGLDSLGMVMSKYMGPQFNAAQLAPLKPAAVTTQIALLESLSAMGTEQAQAIAQGKQLDSEVQDRALAAGKTVIAFETADEQMSLLMGAPISEQAEQLMKAIGQSLDGTSSKNAIKLTEAYMSQNLDAIAELMLNSESTPKELDRLIYNRNKNWAAKLTSEILPSKSVLIAVGAGHLPGKQGLIELLRNAGYTVSPVK